MRTKNFILNSVSTGLYQIALIISGFILPRIMLNYYGSEINGLVSSISQFIVYFNLVEAGLSSATIYSLYKPLANKDYRVINSIISAAKKFYTKSGYIFLSLVVGLSFLYPLYIDTNSLSVFNISVLVLILGGNGVLEFFTLSKYRVLLAADQKTYIISIASLAHIILNTIVIVVLVSVGYNIVVVRFFALLTIFSRSIILYLYTRKKYKYIDYKEVPNYDSLNKRWDALYLQILGAIHQGAPVIILTLVVKDLKLVSVYSVFNMIVGAINGLLSIFVSGLSASFGEVLAEGEISILQKAYNEFEFLYYILISIVYSIAFISIMPFIRLYTIGISDIEYNIPLIGFLFVLNGLLYNIKTPQGMLINSSGLFRETRIQTTIQGAITVIVGLILSSFYGIVGVLIGSILSNLYRDIDLIMFVPKNITRLQIKKSISRVFFIFVSMIIVCLSYLFFEFNPTSYLEWGGSVIIIASYSFIISFIINYVSDKKTTKDVARRILGVMRK